VFIFCIFLNFDLIRFFIDTAYLTFTLLNYSNFYNTILVPHNTVHTSYNKTFRSSFLFMLSVFQFFFLIFVLERLPFDSHLNTN